MSQETPIHYINACNNSSTPELQAELISLINDEQENQNFLLYRKNLNTLADEKNE